ncbi:AAA family ATPase [Aliivibrio wodanis]|uniref:AAA family ATPase n=1 Tax=Aliivibrio wodanis TaxID=80852 RepID=UPI00406C81A6
MNRNIQKEVLARKGSLNINKLSCQYNELTCREKLYYAYKYDKESFEDFVFTYTNIFPNVRKIIPTLIKRHVSSKDDGRIIFIDIEMKDGKKVPQGNISSGMFKAMMILSELLMGNNNSPIIIDEIENSLGVNCLPDILSELQTAQNQVIITSHHPRVINDISKNYWKVVSREKNGNIRTYPANEVLDFESNHDNFLLLLNSSIYRGRT